MLGFSTSDDSGYNFCYILNMKKLLLIIVLFFTGSALLKAQTLKGIVMELNSSKPIDQVEVKNLTTKRSIETNSSGEFSIDIKLNELLSFHYPGYRVDTLFVTDLEFKRIYLTPIPGFNILKDVEITELSDVQLDEQIRITEQQGKIVGTAGGGEATRDGGQRRGGIAISPSRLFGKEAKEARRFHDLLIAEKKDRAIMFKFNPLLITSITPLSGKDLDLFIVKYKPSYEFIEKSDEEQIRLYIMDSFKEFNNLSPQEKGKIELKSK